MPVRIQPGPGEYLAEHSGRPLVTRDAHTASLFASSEEARAAAQRARATFRVRLLLGSPVPARHLDESLWALEEIDRA